MADATTLDAEDKTVTSEDLARELEATKQQLAKEKADKAKADAELATERTQRQAAEKRAGDARGAQVTEFERRLASDETAVDNYIAAAQAEADSYEGQIAQLQDDGKWTEAAAVQRKMTKAEAKVLQGESQKGAIKTARERFKAQQAAAAEAAKTKAEDGADDTDPYAYYTPAAKAWLQARPAFLSDQKYHNKVMAAHYAAIAQDLEPDSKAYFDYIETSIGERKAEKNDAGNGHDDTDDLGDQRQDEDELEPPPPPRRQVSAAAPVNRRGAPDQPRRGQPVRLSPEEREAADISMAHIPDAAERYSTYAKHKANLKAQGRLN